jgi:hypothetical protein
VPICSVGPLSHAHSLMCAILGKEQVQRVTEPYEAPVMEMEMAMVMVMIMVMASPSHGLVVPIATRDPFAP